MKNSGKARKAAFRLIILALIVLGLVLAGGLFAIIAGTFVMASSLVLVAIWVCFALFTLLFFRDPTPEVPSGAKLIVSPAHGKIDVVDTTTEPLFMGGECQRLSIFLSVFDVHVQNAPAAGKLAFFRYTAGQFLNALRTDCSSSNENILLGFECADPAGAKVGVRLVAGAIARRIVPFVQQGDELARGDRISLIQFGSRANVYLPMNAKLKIKLGDRVVGGETVLATFE